MRAAKGEGSAFKTDTGYRGYVTINGNRKYFSAKTKAEAAQKKRELLNRRDDGKLVAGKVPTVAQWMNHWLENVAKHRPTTFAMDKWVTDTKIIPALGTVKLSMLTAEQIEQWLSTLKVEDRRKDKSKGKPSKKVGMPLAPSSQRRYLAPLKTALNVAAKRGHLPFNPAERVELVALGKPQTDAFSREDRDAILAAATGRNRARWHLALRMGLRPAEVLGFTWPDFDAKAGTITVRNQLLRATGTGFYLQPAPKTKAGYRPIRLPKSLVALLVEHRQEQMMLMAERGAEWVGWDYNGQPVALMFPQANGKPVGAHTDTDAWHALLEAAGLSAVRRYKSRHTAATHMIVDSGGDVAVTAKVLGHADPSFTYRTYVHPLEEREAALAEKLDAPFAPYVAPYEPSEGERQLTAEDADR